MTEEVIITIKGIVQGVNYRRETQKIARQLGLNGFARNNTDGSVTVCAQGQHEALEKLVEWCRKGPEDAEVETLGVDYHQSEERFFSFEVK